MTTFKVVRDIDPLTRRPSAHRYEAESLEAVAQHFEAEAQREVDIAENCIASIARKHHAAAKTWKQAAAILRATTLVPTL